MAVTEEHKQKLAAVGVFQAEDYGQARIADLDRVVCYLNKQGLMICRPVKFVSPEEIMNREINPAGTWCFHEGADNLTEVVNGVLVPRERV